MVTPSIVINIFLLKINSFENASSVCIGQNLLADWNNYDKKNQGYGQIFGDDAGIMGNRSMVDDRDGVDAPMHNEVTPFDQRKYLRKEESN